MGGDRNILATFTRNGGTFQKQHERSMVACIPTMKIVLLLIVACFTGVICASDVPGSDRDLRLSKIVDTPDLPQRQSRLPASGGAYCAPVSVSNALVWLSKQGYPRLLDNEAVNGDHIELARVLGSPEFMETNEFTGTGPDGVLNGIRKYVCKQGYSIARLETQGWRMRSSASKTTIRHASLDWVARELDGKAVIFLNVGWYSRAEPNFVRHGGHWVTLVAVKQNPDGYTLLIRDPGGRSGVNAHERVKATRIEGGVLEGDQKQLPLAADGAWELGGELKIGKQGMANTSVLDAVVLLELN